MYCYKCGTDNVSIAKFCANCGTKLESLVSLDIYKKVVLVNSGKNMLAVIKKIRELTGLGLKEAKDKAECTPSVIMENITENQAFMIESAFKAIGAVVEIS